MSLSNFRFPTSICFGVGSQKKSVDFLEKQGLTRPLVVTDSGFSSQPGFRTFLSFLLESGFKVKVFHEIKGNPGLSHVMQGLETFKQHQADCVVSIGGGSPIDVAKAICLMSGHPGELFDYEDGKPNGRPIDQPIPFHLAIPTTAGTGSEVGGSSVISDDQTHRKYIIWADELVPNQVIADPELTLSLPAWLTAATGIDALTHNLEAYLSPNYHPMCEGIALQGIKLIAENLSEAVHNGQNIEVRSNMLMAAMMGAVAFQKGLGVTHSLAHSLSTCFDVHHGLANSLTLIPAMEYNFSICKEKFDHLALSLKLGEDGKNFIGWLKDCVYSLPLPSLQDLGATITDSLVDIAYEDPCHANNPRKVSREDIRELYVRAFAIPHDLTKRH